ncbi:unnamed protein product [Bursaphelenchus okinawaensis]|uniref:Uncharacterized protein n=1 Tax=Bursaphelenchus okinawaensis TaxID=465554 RepID=A0A811LQ58_9BILA|nr:unnamed protein product [Bursaphelenchus okinawaensis]CAG9126012.1 unnamed protein product [Bursaphelenchus okinawaensis]
MELDYFDYGQLDSFDSSLHSVSPVSLYTPSYNYLDTYDYNNYYTYHYPHRTVPPFLDTTTHRDHFRWKISNKEV